ncbi:MAG TPA: (2Fe-2S)-binding protein [Planktothrix sp.]|jgi:bacterioferritin-associated ferredoxin
MYICICAAVNERRIKEAVANGTATTWKELTHKLDVANQCGKCAFAAKDLFDQEIAKKNQKTP